MIYFPRVRTLTDILPHMLPHMDENNLREIQPFLKEHYPIPLDVEGYIRRRRYVEELEEQIKREELKERQTEGDTETAELTEEELDKRLRFHHPLYLNWKQEGFYTLDYAFQVPSTFDNPVVREARGIKFDSKGNLISRPLHKFFNYGERPEEQAQYDFNQATLQEKLDGSLIHPMWIDNKVRLVTKAGVSEVSLQLEEEQLLSEAQLNLLGGIINRNYTPILEYTSPTNRIVIKYDQPQLTLLAVRDNYTGEYLDIYPFAETLNLPTPKVYTNITIEDIREWKDKEGVVAVFSDGNRIKLKANHYVLKHKTKDSLRHEKDVLAYILSDQVDDLSSMLSPEDYSQVLSYTNQVITGINNTVQYLKELVKEYEGVDRRQVALEITKRIKGFDLACFWLIFEGNDSKEVIINYMKRKISSTKGREQIRHIIGPEWVF